MKRMLMGFRDFSTRPAAHYHDHPNSGCRAKKAREIKAMDLYVIQYIDNDGSDLKAICSTKERAEALMAKKWPDSNYYRIEHWILDGNE